MSRKASLVLAGGLVAVGVAAAAILGRLPIARDPALAARQHAMEMLGARIAKLRPACKVLVLANPFTRDAGYRDAKRQYEQVGLRGLRKGLGARSPVKVVFPEIRPEYYTNPQSVSVWADSPTPLSSLMRPASVDQLAAAHPECGVIVSLIGLPVGVDALRIWSEKDPRSFALLLPDLRVLGPPANAVEAFARGKLLAAVVEDGESGESLIITRDNIETVLKRQPKALGY